MAYDMVFLPRNPVLVATTGNSACNYILSVGMCYHMTCSITAKAITPEIIKHTLCGLLVNP